MNTFTAQNLVDILDKHNTDDTITFFVGSNGEVLKHKIYPSKYRAVPFQTISDVLTGEVIEDNRPKK